MKNLNYSASCLLLLVFAQCSFAQTSESFCYSGSTYVKGYQRVLSCETETVSNTSYDLRVWRKGKKYILSRVDSKQQNEKCTTSSRVKVDRYFNIFSIEAKFPRNQSVYIYTNLLESEDLDPILSIGQEVYRGNCVK